MSSVIAFPVPPHAHRRESAVPRAFGQVVTIAATGLLLLAVAGFGYVSLRPDRPSHNPAALDATPEPASTIPQFLIDWAAARSSGDVNLLSTFYVSPDVQFHDYALGLDAMNRGQFRSLMSDLGIQSGKPVYVLTGGFIDDTRAVAEWTATGSDQGFSATDRAPSGKPFTIHGVSVFELRDGKIAVQHDYYDLYGILDQVDGFAFGPDAEGTPTP